MAMVVKNNMSAVTTLNTLNKNSSTLQKSLAKVSSGLKITSAQDDASGFAISERMRVRIRSLDQATQNSQNGSSLMKTAEGALGSTIEILKTLKEKAINAATDTNTDEDRATIQKEVNQLVDQIDDNALVMFNGKYLLEGSKTQSGVQTYTAMTNESLALDTVGDDKITSLRNRKGESLEINSTDKLTASYVKNGMTYSTSYNVGNTTLNDIFANLNALTESPVFGTSKIVSGDDAINPIYSDITLASGTIRSASLADLRKSFNAEPTADFQLELAAMNTEIGTSQLVENFERVELGGTTTNVYTLVRDAIISDLTTTMATNTGVISDTVTLSTGFVQITHTDGTVEKVALYNPGGTETLDNGTDSSFASAADKIMEYIDEKLKDILANGTETNVDSNTLLGILQSSDLVINMGGRDTVNGVETSVTENTTTFTTDSAIFAAGAEEIDSTANYAQRKIEAIYVKSFNGLVMSNDDVGIVPADSVTKTVDKHKGLTVTSANGGLNGQISGLTINITNSEGQNRKSVNEFLNGFKTTIFAANESSDHSLNIHVGAEANLSIAIGMMDMRAAALGLKGTDGSVISLATLEQANAAISVFENALQKALDQQTTIGAILARLEYTASNLTTSSENVQAAESTIRDADMAKEMTEYTKSNVLLQAAQSMLAQANQNSSAVLSLLQ